MDSGIDAAGTQSLDRSHPTHKLIPQSDRNGAPTPGPPGSGTTFTQNHKTPEIWNSDTVHLHTSHLQCLLCTCPRCFHSAFLLHQKYDFTLLYTGYIFFILLLLLIQLLTLMIHLAQKVLLRMQRIRLPDILVTSIVCVQNAKQSTTFGKGCTCQHK